MGLCMLSGLRSAVLLTFGRLKIEPKAPRLEKARPGKCVLRELGPPPVDQGHRIIQSQESQEPLGFWPHLDYGEYLIVDRPSPRRVQPHALLTVAMYSVLSAHIHHCARAFVRRPWRRSILACSRLVRPGNSITTGHGSHSHPTREIYSLRYLRVGSIYVLRLVLPGPSVILDHRTPRRYLYHVESQERASLSGSSTLQADGWPKQLLWTASACHGT